MPARTGCCLNPTIIKYNDAGNLLWQKGYKTDIDGGGTESTREQFLTSTRIRVDQARAKVWSIGAEANRHTSQSPPQLIRTNLSGLLDLHISDFACVCFDLDSTGGIVAFGNAGGPTDSTWRTASGWKFWFFDSAGVATGSCSPSTSPTSLNLQSNLTVYALAGGDILAGWVDTSTLAFKLARFDRAGATVWIRTAPAGATAVINGVGSTRFLTSKGDVLDLATGATVGTFATVAPFNSSLTFSSLGIAIGDQLPIVFSASTATPAVGIAVLNLATIAIDQLWTTEAGFAGSIYIPPPATYGWPSDPTARLSMNADQIFASRDRIDATTHASIATVFAIDRATNLVAWEQIRKTYGVDTDCDADGNVYTAGPLVNRILISEWL